MLSAREIGGISYALNIEKEEFIKKFLELKKIHKTKIIENRIYEISGECYVIKKNNNGDCPFYIEKDNKSYCNIYEYRPIVCRLFPFTWEYFPDTNSINIDYSENGWNNCQGIEKNKQSNWDDIRDIVTGNVILSMIQSNELQMNGKLTQKLKIN